MYRKTISEGSPSITPFSHMSDSHRSDTTGETLILYICRVPGSADVFLTLSKPPGSTVSAVDVLTCVYYVHVDSNQALSGSTPVALKLLRRVMGQDPFEQVADLFVPAHSRHEDTTLKNKVFANVAIFSGRSGGPTEYVSQFEISRQGVALDQTSRTSASDHEERIRSEHGHGAESFRPWDEKDSMPIRRPSQKRKHIWKRLTNNQEARTHLSFTTSFGKKYVMKSSIVGDNLKTYEENGRADGDSSRLLAAELRFNLAPESANRSNPPSKARSQMFKLQKRKSMSFLNENWGPARPNISISSPLSNHHHHQSKDSHFRSTTQSHTNFFPNETGGLPSVTDDEAGTINRKYHPNRSPLPPPPPDVLTQRYSNLDNGLRPKPSISRKPVPPRRTVAQENVRPQVVKKIAEPPFDEEAKGVVETGDYPFNRLSTQTLGIEGDRLPPPPLPIRRETLDNDPLALGRQQLGGGMDGQQAKLGKILIYSPGLRMTDAMVAANIAIWYQGFLQSSFSTTIEM